MRIALFVLALLVTTHVYAAEKAATLPAKDTCHAASHATIIGKTEAQLADIIFKTRSVRVLAKNAPATMDFNPARLNVLLDATGKVEQLTCG